MRIPTVPNGLIKTHHFTTSQVIQFSYWTRRYKISGCGGGASGGKGTRRIGGAAACFVNDLWIIGLSGDETVTIVIGTGGESVSTVDTPGNLGGSSSVTVTGNNDAGIIIPGGGIDGNSASLPAFGQMGKVIAHGYTVNGNPRGYINGQSLYGILWQGGTGGLEGWPGGSAMHHSGGSAASATSDGTQYLTTVYSGGGGASMFGDGGNAGGSTSGEPGHGYGSGGGGTYKGPQSGAGAPGIIIIEEWT